MSNAYAWYQQLIKPSWAPPSWLFGPVWTVLYIIIGVTFGWVFYKTATGKLKKRVAVPFAPDCAQFRREFEKFARAEL